MLKKFESHPRRDFKANYLIYWNNLSRLTNMLIISNFSLFFLTDYIRQELRNPLIYFSSALIRILVIWMMNRFSIVAVLIPLVVQTAVQAMRRFKNRDAETLLLLPGQREDPAFIMDLDGNILLTTGNTERLFKKNAIRNISDLIEADGFDRLIRKLDHRCPDPETRSGKHFHRSAFEHHPRHCGARRFGP